MGFVSLELGTVTPRIGSSTLTVAEAQVPALGPASLLVMGGLLGLVGYLGAVEIKVAPGV